MAAQLKIIGSGEGVVGVCSLALSPGSAVPPKLGGGLI